jgi:L-iditol 2-dehydrogenase
VCRAQRLVNVGKGLTVLILGSGVSGILHAQLAKLRGVKKVFATDISHYRLGKIETFGADRTFHASEDIPSKLLEHNDNRLADIVIVCTGAMSAAKQALKCVAPGGKVLFFAVPGPGVNLEVPINDYWRNEITITTSYGAAPDDLQESYVWILSKKINITGLITHRFLLSKAEEAFKVVSEASESLKVILEPNV